MKRNLPLTAALLLIVFLGVFSCRKEYSFEKAAGTLKDSLNNCSPIQIAGHYRKGIQLTDDSFFVTVTVNVTKTGMYKIYTDQGNGFMFSDSGKFTRLGIQQVRLKASGSPIKDTLTYFNCYFSGSQCSFSIDVNESSSVTPSGTMPVDTWWFIDSTDGTYHHGKVNHPGTWFQPGSLVYGSPVNYLLIHGWPLTVSGTTTTIDTALLIEMFLPRNVIDTGSYSVIDGVGFDNSLHYDNNAAIPGVGGQSFFYYYVSDPYQTPDFNFHLVSYDSTQKLLTGTFKGISLRRREYSDYVGQPHTIYGAFYAKLD